jgi:hypothetical protein
VSAPEERNRVFDAALAALSAAGLPSEPLPTDYQLHRLLVLAGPKTWIRYFLWAEPAKSRLAAGLYVPKGRYGAAVHTLLLRDRATLANMLGGPIWQHKEVQREFRHYVSREHRYRRDTVPDAVDWCVERVRAAQQFVQLSTTLLDSNALRAVHADLIKPTDDPVALQDAVGALLSVGELEKPVGNEKPPERTSPPGKRFVREPQVIAYVLKRAGRKCEACLEVAPFLRDDGTPFLEVHHLQMLAEGGHDTPENAAGVCPNCHRRLHYGSDRVSLTAEVSKRLFG